MEGGPNDHISFHSIGSQRSGRKQGLSRIIENATCEFVIVDVVNSF